MIKDRERTNRLDDAIYNTQNYIWREAKDIMNIHDIGSGAIPMSEEEKKDMKKVFDQEIKGTWRYGPMKNPTKPPFLKNKNRNSTSKLLKRLEQEDQDAILKEKNKYL